MVERMSSMCWQEAYVKGETPSIKNHTATLVGRRIFVFGGYDGQNNHNDVHVLDTDTLEWNLAYRVRGTKPQGRNGHTATMAPGHRGGRGGGGGGGVATAASADYSRIFILGGWLGRGPLAAQDMHVLHIREGVEGASAGLADDDGRDDVAGPLRGLDLEWEEPKTHGTAPGPCNMHTADFIEPLRQVLVFRGGDGREYLNDLHALDVDSMTWRNMEGSLRGEPPFARANHSSAVIGHRLFIFGGWDGQKRLNDIHVLDTSTWTWHEAVPRGSAPHPRAGMTFANLRDRLFLFGGSGPSTKCFNDLQVLDPATMSWVDTVSQLEGGGLHEGAGMGSTVGGGGASGAMGAAHADRHRHRQGSSVAKMSDVEAASSPVHSFGSSGAALAALGGDCVAAAAGGDGDANPNDFDGGEQIVVMCRRGKAPAPRAGHTATVFGRKMLVFGGSLGKDYLSEFFILDTDPPPEALVSLPSSAQILQASLGQFVDTEDFSDVTFLVEGRRVHAHRLVLSLLSERFRAMFAPGGFREASQKEVVMDDVSHASFLLMLRYLYTGTVAGIPTEPTQRLHAVVELLQTADQFMLDHLKQQCESILQQLVDAECAEKLLQISEMYNAAQLKRVCQHFIRNSYALSSRLGQGSTAAGGGAGGGGGGGGGGDCSATILGASEGDSVASAMAEMRLSSARHSDHDSDASGEKIS